MTPRGVRWISDVPGSGYGDAAMGYLGALEQMGVAVTWTPTKWVRGDPRPIAAYDGPGSRFAYRDVEHDTVVLHTPPVGHDRMLHDVDDRRLVSCTVWETEAVPDGWAEALERFDAVLVPSEFNRRALAASTCRTPCHVVPHCAGHGITQVPAPLSLDRFGDRFVFYTIGTWSTRKAMAETIDAYLDAFEGRDDTGLVIKTGRFDSHAVYRSRHGLPPGGPAGWETAAWPTVATLLGRRRRLPEVHLIANDLPAAGVDALHARGDCFLSLTRSEGWGLCIADAILFGNPVVVTGWGGHLDYLGEDYPLLVDYDLVPTTSDPRDDWFPFDDHHRWARARHDHAVELLRWVADHPSEAAALAPPIAARLAGQCSPAAVGTRLLDALALGAPR